MRTAVLSAFVSLVLSSSAQDVTIADGWVELPEEGATSTRAYAVIQNPSMYDVYLTSVSSSVAGTVEFRMGADEDARKVKEVTVPAYGRLTMKSDGVYMFLSDLASPLEENESVTITVTTDTSAKLRVEAVVRGE